MRKKGLLELIVRAVRSLQKQKLERDLSYLKNVWNKLVYIKNLCCHHFLQLQ